MSPASSHQVSCRWRATARWRAFRSRRDRVLSAIVRPGDAMPGGGHLFSISQITGNQKHINNQGDVVFTAVLDTNTGGVPDTGLYQWSKGRLSLIARSGTVFPGVGTIQSLTSPANVIIGPAPGFPVTGGAMW